MTDWIMDHFGWFLAALVVGLFGGIAYAASSDARQTNAACSRMWAAARTSADTIAVIRDCELPKHSETTVVPMPIIISH